MNAPEPSACTAKTICSGVLSRRHCRRSQIQWQLLTILACPRNRQGARQRCCPFGKRRCVGKTYPIRCLSSKHPPPSPHRGTGGCSHRRTFAPFLRWKGARRRHDQVAVRNRLTTKRSAVPTASPVPPNGRSYLARLQTGSIAYRTASMW